ncbi:unnamed protein product [Prorocentrum cordatum]|uniref:Uncharacterized protein n=1 Tax=Prorocentrum cordatum TaxID=2364126 RepID=A0ABN9WMJ2_9DINO|nr:unnamed protein product [Polarella glacialis]
MAQASVDTGEGLDDDSTMRLLSAQNMPLLQAQRIPVTDGLMQDGLPKEVRAVATELRQRVTKSIAKLNQTKSKVMAAKLKHEKAAPRGKAAGKGLAKSSGKGSDSQVSASAEGLPELLAAAEDVMGKLRVEVEIAAITAAPLEGPMDGQPSESLEAAMNTAVDDVERIAKKAKGLLLEAKTSLNTTLMRMRRLAAGRKTVELASMEAMQKELPGLNEKVTQYLKVRENWEERKSASKVVDEIMDKLVSSEILVERAVSMCSTIAETAGAAAAAAGEAAEGGGGVGAEGKPAGSSDTPETGQAEKEKAADGDASAEKEPKATTTRDSNVALGKAQVALAQVGRMIETKLKDVKNPSGPLGQELTCLRNKHKELAKTLQDGRQRAKDAKSQAASDVFLSQLTPATSKLEDLLPGTLRF